MESPQLAFGGEDLERKAGRLMKNEWDDALQNIFFVLIIWCKTENEFEILSFRFMIY